MRLLFSAVFLTGFSLALGQNFVDLANVYGRFSPNNKVQNASDKVDFTMLALDAKVPVVLSEKCVLIPGVEIMHNRITNQVSQQDWLFSHTTLQLGVEFKPNSRFKTLIMAMPKFSTTFTGGIDQRDFQFGGVCLNTLKRNDNFDWRFGAYVNSELFSVMIVPLLGFNWKINETWRLKMLIPVNLELSKTVNERLITGLLFIGANASYRMRQQINPFTTYPGNYQPYMDKADNNAWLYGDVYLTKNLVLNIKAGHSVLRKYRLYDETDKLVLKLGPVNVGDDRMDVAPLMENGWSFETRLIFRMPLK